MTTLRQLSYFAAVAQTGSATRAAALLTRQALELVIDAALARRIPDLDGVAMRVKLACLIELTDPAAAHEAAWLWARLSTACHHHPYDLAPTGDELTEWISRVEALLVNVRGR